MAKSVHLPYKKTYQDKKGYYKKQYRSSAKDCGKCPLRTSCIGGRADYKKLEETIDKPLYDQMHARLQTPYAKKMKTRRQATVEPVLGTLINFMGLRRIWTRGIKNANKFMLGAAIAYNLKKWLNYQEQKRKTAIVAIKKTGEGLCFLFLMLWHSIVVCNAKTKIDNCHQHKEKKPATKTGFTHFLNDLCNCHLCCA